jgi:tRNA modification GTPase
LKNAGGDELDRALVVYFQGPASFTGEDVVELHLHGSLAVQDAVLNELMACEGFRLAEAGEFTRRALANGKMDLAEVEGLSDLIDAETEAQRVQAQKMVEGKLRERVMAWRNSLAPSTSLIEDTTDLPFDEVPEDVPAEVSRLLSDLILELNAEIAGSKVAERLRSGFEVAIVGAPNVGKSTLMNAIAGRDVAITSSIAGTTRDVIEVRLNLDGIPVTLLDTAGVRESDDEIEQIGVERTISRAKSADLRVFLRADGVNPEVDLKTGDISVYGKSDVTGQLEGAVSGLTGAGVDKLLADIAKELRSRVQRVGVASRERHERALSVAVQNLMSALDLVRQGTEFYDVSAEELRSAARAIEGILGFIGVEDILDEIFANFCLGK